MTTLRGFAIPAALTVLLVLPVSAAERYFAKRTTVGAVAGRAPASPSMRIGELVPLTSTRAATTLAAVEPVIRRGLTPAGGLTVELDGRFTTQFTIRDDGSRSAAECSADERTEAR